MLFNASKTSTTSIPPPTIGPALSPTVLTSLTAVFITLYGCLFILIYVQLWMILYYRHRRFSYQTVFLFLCLVWAGLRTTLFSFYFKNAVLASSLQTPLYWLLYCFPVCLQFITLCLLVEFFSQVVFRTRIQYEPNSFRRIHVRILLSLAVMVFLATNITCAIYEQRYQSNSDTPPLEVLVPRVVINGLLFIVASVALSFCIYKISKTSSANMVLEATDITVRQAIVICVFVICLYTSRALYNMVAISKPLSEKILNFGYDWVNVSDQVDFGSLNRGMAYISFGVVLFVWEFLPTFLVVMFFRVKKPNNQMQMLNQITSQSYHRRHYFYGTINEAGGEGSRQAGDGSSMDRASPINVENIAEVEFYNDHFGSYTQYDMPGTPPPLKITHDMLFEADESDEMLEEAGGNAADHLIV